VRRWVVGEEIGSGDGGGEIIGGEEMGEGERK